MNRIVFEIALDDIGTEGLREQMQEYELDLWDVLSERVRSEVALGLGVVEADNCWTIAGHSGQIIGARLQGGDDRG